MNPNLVWNGRFRLITHRPTHTPQLCVSQHLRCFQAGSFRLCVKKARTGNSVHCNRGPCLGQKSPPLLGRTPGAHWNLDGETLLPRGSFSIAADLCWNRVSCSAVPIRMLARGIQAAAHQSPPGPPSRTYEYLDTLGFRLPDSSSTIPCEGFLNKLVIFRWRMLATGV